MTDRKLILKSVSAYSADLALRSSLQKALRNDATRVLAGKSSEGVSVTEATNLWATRLGNTDLTGKSYVGLTTLLQTLALLNQEVRLDQVAFIAPDCVGNLFFDQATQRFLGGVVTDRDVQSQEQAA